MERIRNFFLWSFVFPFITSYKMSNLYARGKWFNTRDVNRKITYDILRKSKRFKNKKVWFFDGRKLLKGKLLAFNSRYDDIDDYHSQKYIIKCKGEYYTFTNDGHIFEFKPHDWVHKLNRPNALSDYKYIHRWCKHNSDPSVRENYIEHFNRIIKERKLEPEKTKSEIRSERLGKVMDSIKSPYCT